MSAEFENVAETKAFLSLLMEARFDEAYVDEDSLAFNLFLNLEARDAGGFVIRVGIEGSDSPLWIRYKIAFDKSAPDNIRRWGIYELTPGEDACLAPEYPSDWVELPVFP